MHTSLLPKFTIHQAPSGFSKLTMDCSFPKDGADHSSAFTRVLWQGSCISSTFDISGIAECLDNKQNDNSIKYLWSSYYMGFPGGSGSEESACHAGDLGFIPGSGRSPGEGHANPLQCSCLENPTDRGAWRATVHGTLQARILEWVACPFSRASSQPKDRTQVSCMASRFFTS